DVGQSRAHRESARGRRHADHEPRDGGADALQQEQRGERRLRELPAPALQGRTNGDAHRRPADGCGAAGRRRADDDRGTCGDRERVLRRDGRAAPAGALYARAGTGSAEGRRRGLTAITGERHRRDASPPSFDPGSVAARWAAWSNTFTSRRRRAPRWPAPSKPKPSQAPACVATGTPTTRAIGVTAASAAT